MRRLLAATACTAALALSAASPASAATSSYTILRGSSAYATGSTNLWPAGVDDATVRVTLPFAVRLYGSQARTSVWVSSNGNLQFGPSPSAAYANTCLPDGAGLSGPSILAYWDDILIRPNASTGDGVFTKTIGTGTNRQFVISWKGVLFNDADYPVRAEVVFYQNQTYFETRYGVGDGAGATIGVENFYRTDVSQWSCNDAVRAPDPNQSLRFNYTP